MTVQEPFVELVLKVFNQKTTDPPYSLSMKSLIRHVNAARRDARAEHVAAAVSVLIKRGEIASEETNLAPDVELTRPG